MWGITAVTVAQNLREDGSLSPEYTFGTFIMQQTLQAAHYRGKLRWSKADGRYQSCRWYWQHRIKTLESKNIPVTRTGGSAEVRIQFRSQKEIRLPRGREVSEA